MAFSAMLRRVALVRTAVSEELSPLVFLRSVRRLLVTAIVVPSSPILDTLMKEALSYTKCRFLQEPHGITSQKMPFFIVFSSYLESRKTQNVHKPGDSEKHINFMMRSEEREIRLI
jgi:hypothetical protein